MAVNGRFVLCLEKKKSLFFLSLPSPPPSSKAHVSLVPEGVTLAGKHHKGHTVILSSQPYGNILLIGYDGGGKKPRLDQEQLLISLSLLTHTHRTAVSEKMALIYLLPLCQRKL